MYVGLWRGPTEDQLQTLHQASMPVICAQNEVGLLSKFNKIIVGWMHGDEPDNAQAKRDGKGYDPPILPSAIVEDYQRLRQKDSKRPIFLNLGQGVAYDQYIGRGTRRNHPEDYAEYAQGSDIVSFDIYPAVHDKPEIAGKLEYVPRGVARLREWTKDQKIVWNCIECSRISNAKTKPTPDQIRSEVWMSHSGFAGSRASYSLAPIRTSVSRSLTPGRSRVATCRHRDQSACNHFGTGAQSRASFVRCHGVR